MKTRPRVWKLCISNSPFLYQTNEHYLSMVINQKFFRFIDNKLMASPPLKKRSNSSHRKILRSPFQDFENFNSTPARRRRYAVHLMIIN